MSINKFGLENNKIKANILFTPSFNISFIIYL